MAEEISVGAKTEDLAKPDAVWHVDGKITRLEVHNMMKDMDRLWFVAEDKEARVHVEWNMSKEGIHRFIEVLKTMLGERSIDG